MAPEKTSHPVRGGQRVSAGSVMMSQVMLCCPSLNWTACVSSPLGGGVSSGGASPLEGRLTDVSPQTLPCHHTSTTSSSVSVPHVLKFKTQHGSCHISPAPPPPPRPGGWFHFNPALPWKRLRHVAAVLRRRSVRSEFSIHTRSVNARRVRRVRGHENHDELRVQTEGRAAESCSPA